MFKELIEHVKNNKPADVKVVIGTHPLSYCDESQALLYFKEAKAKVSITQTDAITPMYVCLISKAVPRLGPALGGRYKWQEIEITKDKFQADKVWKLIQAIVEDSNKFYNNELPMKFEDALKEVNL
jgi:hypothetical protein